VDIFDHNLENILVIFVLGFPKHQKKYTCILDMGPARGKWEFRTFLHVKTGIKNTGFSRMLKLSPLA